MADVLTHEPLPANANDRALKGRASWRGLRVGELRIWWQAVGNGERTRMARVIHRRDLERAIRTLGD
jgi:hypothetical protein